MGITGDLKRIKLKHKVLVNALYQGWATIFVRVPHEVVLSITRGPDLGQKSPSPM